jgi:hypothetical protein
MLCVKQKCPQTSLMYNGLFLDNIPNDLQP